MTVQNTVVKNKYVGNGTTTVFPFTFEIDEKHPEYIKVYISTDGIAKETKNFRVDMNTKNVIYPKDGSPLPVGSDIVIYRSLPLHQLLNLVNQGPYFAEDVEQSFDDLTYMLQQLDERVGRTLLLDVSAGDVSTVLPAPVAGQSFRWNSDGTGIETTKDPAEVEQTIVSLHNEMTSMHSDVDNKLNKIEELAGETEENTETVRDLAGEVFYASMGAEEAAHTIEGQLVTSTQLKDDAAESARRASASATASANSASNASASATASANSANEAYTYSQNAEASADAASKVMGVILEGTNMQGATATSNGSQGLVPAPLQGEQNKFLQGNGQWASLATVATSGSYTDLANKPSLNFLPLSGGKMTASILSTTGNKAPVLKNSNASGVGGGELYLMERDDVNYKGGFLLRATSTAENPTPQGGTFIDLIGKSNGQLMWGYKHIVRSINNINADANGNVALSVYNSSSNANINFNRSGWAGGVGYYLEANSTGIWKNLLDYNNLINKPNADGIIAQSLGENGYVKFANGLIMQWGIALNVPKAGSGNEFLVTFPLAMTTFLSGSLTFKGNKNQDAVPIIVTSSGSSMTISHNGIESGGTSTTNIHWIIIGI